jgi:hypothetical protein
VQSPLTWIVPGGNYRGGGIWLRYTDGASTCPPVEEAAMHPERIAFSPAALLFLAQDDGPEPAPCTLVVEQTGCEPSNWSVTDNAGSLHTQRLGQTVRVSVDTTALSTSTWQATIAVDAGTGVMGSPVQVPVTPVLADGTYRNYSPSLFRQ